MVTSNPIDYTVWRSPDDAVWALRNAPREAMSAALNAGARIVVFVNDAPPVAGVLRGGWRVEPRVGDLINTIRDRIDDAVLDGESSFADEALEEELAQWEVQPGGGMFARSAPRTSPVEVDATALAEAFYEAYLQLRRKVVQ